MSAGIKLGADCFSQGTPWVDYVAAMIRAEELGYDSLWTPDHVLPTVPGGNGEGDILEAMMCLAGVAQATSRATLGLLVSPITLRNPAVLTKMVTTLDHISGGRAILGVGAGWAEEEHRQYGIEFGDGFGERLRWLSEALPVMRGMLDGVRPSASGPRYSMVEVLNNPPPVQRRLPIMIAGSGPRITLRLVAEHGDMCNMIGPPEFIGERDQVLVSHCEAIGREPSEIERTVAFRQPVIRDSEKEARAVAARISAHHGIDPPFLDMAGTADALVEQLVPYIDLGFRHLIFQFLSPFDDETMERTISDVRPMLESV
jgi:alkanesulfonate monooxygenase SsuD/methylene tetrahydromethanopterin reductase-like flavin-dependent oxidoreductase (luciferase family)